MVLNVFSYRDMTLPPWAEISLIHMLSGCLAGRLYLNASI